MNNIDILGRITHNLELKSYGNEGKNRLSFSIAYNERFGNQDSVSFFNVIAFGKQAETISQYFGKGDRILIGGRLKQNIYQDKNGNTKKDIFINLNNFTFIERKTDSQKANNSVNRQDNNGYPQQDFDESFEDTEEVPF